MKEDVIVIKSNLTSKDIGEILKEASRKLKANAENADADPFQIEKPTLAIKYFGKNFIVGPREWCVIAYVYDKNSYREIVLKAIGDTAIGKVNVGFKMNKGITAQYYKLADSVERRDAIARFFK